MSDESLDRAQQSVNTMFLSTKLLKKRSSSQSLRCSDSENDSAESVCSVATTTSNINGMRQVRRKTTKSLKVRVHNEITEQIEDRSHAGSSLTSGAGGKVPTYETKHTE